MTKSNIMTKQNHAKTKDTEKPPSLKKFEIKTVLYTYVSNKKESLIDFAAFKKMEKKTSETQL